MKWAKMILNTLIYYNENLNTSTFLIARLTQRSMSTTCKQANQPTNTYTHKFSHDFCGFHPDLLL